MSLKTDSEILEYIDRIKKLGGLLRQDQKEFIDACERKRNGDNTVNAHDLMLVCKKCDDAVKYTFDTIKDENTAFITEKLRHKLVEKISDMLVCTDGELPRIKNEKEMAEAVASVVSEYEIDDLKEIDLNKVVEDAVKSAMEIAKERAHKKYIEESVKTAFDDNYEEAL